MSNLIDNLARMDDSNEINIDGLFEPSNYLISPFNKQQSF